ncbi:MAG TPA: DUF975 family protein [Syntrophomonadaceae bacterium]|nr:DUF975 family protein [Syntrophomonadaceae bacterium]
MWTRRDLKNRAKEILRLSYWKAFLVSIIIAIAGGSSGAPNFNWNTTNGSGSPWGADGSMMPEFLLFIILAAVGVGLILALAFRIFVGYPLEVGGRKYFVQAQEDHIDMNYLGYNFEKTRYLDVVKSMFYRAFINFLWYLLLFIPGIIMSYAYRMVPYILADNPNIGYKRALQLSTQMTRGHKFSIFVLDLSFIGWIILGILALFVGVLFVMPYVNATNAELYLVLRHSALEQGLSTNEELLL